MIVFKRVHFQDRLSPSEVQPKPPRPVEQLSKLPALHNLHSLYLFFWLSVTHGLHRQIFFKAVLTDITNITSAAQPFNTIIDYLLPGRSSNPPLPEPLPNFERPATPLSVRALGCGRLGSGPGSCIGLFSHRF
jgi:hypothetical protein